MEGLISELEKLSGPDRIVDAKIEISRRKFLFGAAAVAGMIASVDAPGFIVGGAPQPIEAPFYSSSIDAALTLVPEDVALWQINMAYNGHPYEALIIPLPPGNDVYGASKTSPAIALCIACLRARLELSKGGVRS